MVGLGFIIVAVILGVASFYVRGIERNSEHKLNNKKKK